MAYRTWHIARGAAIPHNAKKPPMPLPGGGRMVRTRVAQIVPRAGRRPAPEGESFILEATFMPLVGLGCLFCRRPTRPRLRRPVCAHLPPPLSSPCAGRRKGRGVRRGPPIGTAMLSYAEHGKLRAPAQVRRCPRAMKSWGLAPFGSDSGIVLPAEWTTGRAEAQWAGAVRSPPMRHLGRLSRTCRFADHRDAIGRANLTRGSHRRWQCTRSMMLIATRRAEL